MEIDADPLFGRFGNTSIGVAEAEGRRWIVRDRDWFGWPDPPQFALFIVEADGVVWCATDFSDWPSAWSIEDAAP